ncbi:hypothetical protein [Metabacillus sp. RGM 3146]|uniref:hypothetical protein n=1 Tax=Metabacillus sp. RGM 3146 TaxID=3401092 RepID=UPI003B9AC433
MFKKISITSLFLITGLLLSACGNAGGAANKDNNAEASAAPVAENDKPKEKSTVEKTVDAKATQLDAMGMKVSLGKIVVNSDKITVEMSLENTTDKVLNFYPDGGTATIGDMQLTAQMSDATGKIGGETKGGKKQTGTLVFSAPEGEKIDSKTLKNINLDFGDVSSEDYLKTKHVAFTVPAK